MGKQTFEQQAPTSMRTLLESAKRGLLAGRSCLSIAWGGTHLGSRLLWKSGNSYELTQVGTLFGSERRHIFGISCDCRLRNRLKIEDDGK